jgi:hypothetical protein
MTTGRTYTANINLLTCNGKTEKKSLTPWDRVLLKKPINAYLDKKFPAYYGNRRFITMLTKAHH